LEAAEAYRKRVVAGSNAYRLAHGEGDQLPGLVIDRYGEYFTLQTLDQGMDRGKAEIASCLEELFAPKAIVERNDVSVRKRESLPLESGVLVGEAPEAVLVEMNGLNLYADLLHGQKTGIFLDQRENYVAAARYARGRALDCFTSTGGFALHLAAKCESVEAVDSSEASLKMAERNRAANAISNVEFREADMFDLLAGYAQAHRRFDTVVLDPPAFAKSRGSLDSALLLLASRERSHAAGDRRGSFTRYQSQAADFGTTDAEPGPSDSVDGSRDAVFEVFDFGSAIERPTRASAAGQGARPTMNHQ
jgi:23S rRNA (cytosine1962-C5)-methyltransferase